ncbi:glycosyltransferase [Streptomyces albipurpureus]|uniref:Glycosyltransferase n=1 Tax=Streptomyces albipurpureus TaxID=2897419 RepID=A0ABT0UEI2_9ACTN|nr:glycosyltransferase [Streptomyces sp. CWNU-1]MCM2386715.1 glycosyltransferase [Streptomyces sp. CWNU-1]
MKWFPSAAAMAAALGLVLYLDGTDLSIYGIAVFTLLATKLTASLLHRPKTPTPEERARARALSVTAVITVYNEDPMTFARCLDSLLRQTRPPQNLVVVDDHSADPRALDHARSAAVTEAFARAGIGYQVIAFPANRGKRHALAAGFRAHPEADIFLGVDSDTVLDEAAVDEGTLPFVSPDVNAVTGLVGALNARTNLLTRLIDLRYANAFLYERAAYSLLGSVLCCCGSLAFYRAEVIRANLDDFLTQRFLGRAATFGDDRRMTNYCLQTGRVLLQPTALARTLVPETLGHYLRQQIRWNKSFVRESLWAVKTAPAGRPAFWLSLLELTSWISFTTLLLIALVLTPIHANAHILLLYLVYAMLVGYARSVRYLEADHPNGMPWAERLGTFLLAPLYALLHLTLLLWVRLYSLATLKDNGWGTRESVEVALTATPPEMQRAA